MSTTFNFPPNPTVGQQVTLPNGAIAQWNGTEWASVDDTGVTYPLAITMGGTGATTPSQARFNLGLNTATGEFVVQKDGTVAAPGLAWASEPGLGFWRSAASTVRLASNGFNQFVFDMAAPEYATMTMAPRAAGIATFALRNGALGQANYNQLSISATDTGGYQISEGLSGTATAKSLTLTFPAGVFVRSTGTVNLLIDKAAGNFNNFLTGNRAGTPRWAVNVGNSTAETGGNTGSDFVITRFNDAGAVIGDAFSIVRSTGGAGFGGTVGIAGSMSVAGITITAGGINVASGGATIKDGIELGGNSTITNIDWHTSGGNADFDVRMSVDTSNRDLIKLQSANSAPKTLWEGTGAGIWMQNILIGTSSGGPNTCAIAWLATGSHGGHIGCRVDLYQAGAFAWTSDISDMRYKKDVAPLRYGLDEVLRINPIEWEFDHELNDYLPEGHQYGFSAQEIEAVVSHAIETTNDMLRVNKTALIPILVNAIKTLNQRLTQVENQL